MTVPEWHPPATDSTTFAHGVWASLAYTLAQPIRKAWDEHRATNCIGVTQGVFNCERCVDLFQLLPESSKNRNGLLGVEYRTQWIATAAPA